MSNKWIENNVIERGLLESGHEYIVTKGPLTDRGMAGYNGYVRWPKRPVRERDYGGILAYVPVHGGITYAEEDERGIVYGFDTAHSNSEKYPSTDVVWIKSQCDVMDRAIAVAAQVEEKYLRCVTNKGRAKYAQQVQDVAPDSELGFGALINVLSGRL